MDTLPTRWEANWGTNMELVALEEVRVFTTASGQDLSDVTHTDDVCLIPEDEDVNPGGSTEGDVGHIGPCQEDADRETYTGGASGDDLNSDNGGRRDGEYRSTSPPPHPSYAPCCRYPIKVLSRVARQFLSDHLNPRTVVTGRLQNNWEGLAQLTGRDFRYVISREDMADPCGQLLRDWELEEGHVSSIGKLLSHLKQMERIDIIEHVDFMAMIAKSVNEYHTEQEELAIASEERRNRNMQHTVTCREGTSGEQQKFDAFVFYDKADTEFVMELIYELEYTEGLKLCLNTRDLLLGHEADVTAEMIKSRCKRTLVILSRTFEGNPMCDFALKIAQSLSPAASESKLIPIRIDDCEIPVSLLHIDCVDFELCHIRAWLWARLAATLRLPEEELLMVERQRLRRVILHRSDGGSGTDVRSSMRQTRYIPPLPASWSTSSSSSSRTTASTSISLEGLTRLPPGLSRSRGPRFRERFWSLLFGSRSSISGH